MTFFCWDYGLFTLLFILVGWMIVVEFLVMFFSSKYDTPVDTPTPLRYFLRLNLFDQQMRTSGPPLGRAVQAALVWMSYSLSRSGLVGEANPGKFDFGVGTGGVDINLVEMEVWRRLNFCLGQLWSLPRGCY